MGDFKINEKTVFTQSGSAEPAMGSTITGIPAAGVTGVLPVGVTGGSGLTALASNPTVTLGSNATFPANHCIFVKHHKFASVDASTNPINSNFESWADKNTNSRWTNTSLEVVVPSADVAKCSKIYVHVTTPFEIDPESSSRVNVRLIRVGHITNKSDCLALHSLFGENYNTGNLRAWLSIGGWDDPLTTGDHTYHLEFTKDHNSYATSVKYHGATDDIATMTVWGYV
jgi:hypothetical protein